MNKELAVVVVTYNRIDWLKKNLYSLLYQSKRPDKIYVVDNASDDGTKDYLLDIKKKKEGFIEIITMKSNLGCSGGNYYGVGKAFQDGFEWISIMDDDCICDKQLFNKIFKLELDNNNVYIPYKLAIEDRETLLLSKDSDKNLYSIEYAPFNGFLVHRSFISKAGFPVKDYFIYSDDDEYSMRVRTYGGKLIVVKDAIVYHPNKTKIFTKKRGVVISNILLSKNRVYYNTRNSLINKRKYPQFKYNCITFYQVFKVSIKYIILLRFDLLRLLWLGFYDGLLSRINIKKAL